MNSLQSILAGNGGEFFTNGSEAMVSYQRRQYSIQEAPLEVQNALDRYLSQNPAKLDAYIDMAGKEYKEQCVRCLFSNLDGIPDLTDDGTLTPEYVECDKRSSCKWNGVGCLKAPACQFGLSQREREVADLAELSNKEIAEVLFLSPFTVSTHLQNVQRKMGVKNKRQLIKIRPSLKLSEWK